MGALLKIAARAISKGALYVAVGLIVTLVVLSTYFVPHLGRAVQRLNRALETRIDSTTFLEEICYARKMMIEIVAEQDDPTPKYSSQEPYRDELVRAVTHGKQALIAGEGVLSLSLGGLLLVSQIGGYRLFDAVFSGIRISMLIQMGLLVIAVSILYRTSIIDLLAFSGDEEFSSFKELDAAVSYQRAVSRVGFLQVLTFMIVIGMRLINADRDTIRLGLRLRYDDETSTREWIRILREKRRKSTKQTPASKADP